MWRLVLHRSVSCAAARVELLSLRARGVKTIREHHMPPILPPCRSPFWGGASWPRREPVERERPFRKCGSRAAARSSTRGHPEREVPARMREPRACVGVAGAGVARNRFAVARSRSFDETSAVLVGQDGVCVATCPGDVRVRRRSDARARGGSSPRCRGGAQARASRERDRSGRPRRRRKLAPLKPDGIHWSHRRHGWV